MVEDTTKEYFREEVLEWGQGVDNAQDFEVDKEEDDDEVNTRRWRRYQVSLLVHDEQCCGHSRGLGGAAKREICVNTTTDYIEVITLKGTR